MNSTRSHVNSTSCGEIHATPSPSSGDLGCDSTDERVGRVLGLRMTIGID